MTDQQLGAIAIIAVAVLAVIFAWRIMLAIAGLAIVGMAIYIYAVLPSKVGIVDAIKWEIVKAENDSPTCFQMPAGSAAFAFGNGNGYPVRSYSGVSRATNRELINELTDSGNHGLMCQVEMVTQAGNHVTYVFTVTEDKSIASSYAAAH